MMYTTLLVAVTIVAFLNVADAVTFTSSSCYYWSHWGAFSVQNACDVTCGTGEQKRERTRVCYHPGYFPPPGCRFLEVEKETATCDSGTACDGTVTSWNTWSDSSCSQYCGVGKRVETRTRTCSTEGLCSETLSETRKETCVGLGGHCHFPCAGYRSFIYTLGDTSHVCIRGTYDPITCPAARGDLLSTCDQDYVKCHIFWQIERFCIRKGTTTP